ncbi:hypothetical protein L1887_48479 [Cichorium endivia]|nr:hypothetical protein L1887_48479 [Cichorium endivia]
MSDEAPGDEAKLQHETRIHCISADCSQAADVDRLRKQVSAKFKGLDTLHICFGVSALLPPPGCGRRRSGKARFEAGRLKSVRRQGRPRGSATGRDECIQRQRGWNRRVPGCIPAHAADHVALPCRRAHVFRRRALRHTHSLGIRRDQVGAALSLPLGRYRGAGSPRSRPRCVGFRHSAVDLDASTEMPQDLAWVKGEKMLSAASVAEKTIFAVDRYSHGTLTLPRFYAFATWIDKIFPRLHRQTGSQEVRLLVPA